MSKVNRLVNKINNSLFLAYISTFSPPFLCPVCSRYILTLKGYILLTLLFIKWQEAKKA